MISSSQIDFIPLPEMLGHKNSARRTAFYAVFLVLVTLYVYSKLMPCPKLQMVPREPQQYLYDQESNTTIPYDKNMPLIFIGGMPRSGTTLMRVLLDTHPEVRCGEETRVIPRILGMRTQWERAPTEKRRLREAGITDDVLDAAVTSFILEIIAKHGDAAPRLCNKDPFTLKSSLYLSRLFPQSKYILMVRDGRAVVHSIITRKVTITGFDLKDYRSCMKKWNTAMEVMYAQCIRIGGNRCMPVYYEQLVLHPELWLKRILEFLDLQWDDKLLHHEDYVGKPGGISLSK